MHLMFFILNKKLINDDYIFINGIKMIFSKSWLTKTFFIYKFPFSSFPFSFFLLYLKIIIKKLPMILNLFYGNPMIVFPLAFIK